jgi:hypothetical protein
VVGGEAVAGRRVNRLQALALAVLIGGAGLAWAIGFLVPAQVVETTTGLVTSRTVAYTNSPHSGQTAFNWLLALLVGGPAAMAAATLYAGSQISRSRGSSRGRARDQRAREAADDA